MKEDKSYKEFLKHITTFIFDIDGVLTDGTVLITTTGELLRQMNVKDGYALKTAVENGYRICIISGGKNKGTEKRLNELGIADIYLGVTDKALILKAYLDTYEINIKNTLYMGDDFPDIEAMEMVNLACCPQDAIPEVKQVCQYVSHKNGGQGCVRDIVEQVLKVQGKWGKAHTNAR